MIRNELHISLGGVEFDLLQNIYDRAVFGKEIYDLKNLKVDSRIEGFAISNEIGQLARAYSIDGITARLSTNKRDEIQWLQEAGFYFVETVLHPWIELEHDIAWNKDLIAIREATERDLEALERIACTAFGHERYHQDKNYENRLANKRYAEWVISAVRTDSQQKIASFATNESVIGFCIYELLQKEGICYWHLNAIDPMLQGRGLGKLGWQAMLCFNKRENAKQVKTTISSANTRVLSLYSSLGFRFENTETTFHWVRSQSDIRD